MPEKMLLGLNITAAADRGDLIYERDAHKVLSLVESGQYQAAFFLKPTRIDQFHAVVHAGLRMPPKSTYFHPKALSGVIITLF